MAFDPNATVDDDFSMDAKSINNDLDQEIYIDVNSKPYIIDVNAFDESKKNPLGFRNINEGHYKIEISEILNFNDSQNIYICDNDNNLFHDIKNAEFNLTLPAGTNSSRFEITFNTEIISDITDSELEDFYVVQDKIAQKLTISNPKEIELIDIAIYDMPGKLILKKQRLAIILIILFPPHDYAMVFIS